MIKIYKIINRLNSFVYIGQTSKTLKHRFSQHYRAKSKIGLAMRELGKENFKIIQIDEAISHVFADNQETYYIQLYNSYEQGYNKTKKGGYSGSGLMNKNMKPNSGSFINGSIPWNKGIKMNNEFCDNCRKRNLGKKASIETKKKMSKQRLDKKMKTMSQETKDKISKTLKEKGIKPIKPGRKFGWRKTTI